MLSTSDLMILHWPMNYVQGLQNITGYKQKFHQSTPVNNVNITADGLNEFYARFDRQNKTKPTTNHNVCFDCPFNIEEHQVISLFNKQNIHKAAGPDGIMTKTLKYCAKQLAPVFTDIFNNSLFLQHVPLCFKMSTIIPVQKKSKIMSMNDYRPVALTSVVMKVFERIVSGFLQSCTNSILDNHQFAYRCNRSIEDAVTLSLHSALSHLDTPNSYVRMLFIDYSSAFNTIIPTKLFSKLIDMPINISLCHWILDFLLNRPQIVKFNGLLSNALILNTGAPQGCVLSPLLYSLFTNDCKTSCSSVKIAKFADDTTLVGLISDNNESVYRHEISELVN